MNVSFHTYKHGNAWRSVLAFVGYEAQMYLSPMQSSVFWNLTDYRTFTAGGDFLGFHKNFIPEPGWTRHERTRPWPKSDWNKTLTTK